MLRAAAACPVQAIIVLDKLGGNARQRIALPRDERIQRKGRIVIVGASLAGLRAAEALRGEGFRGQLTIIGDEPGEPYDRPPLSKQVLKGWVARRSHQAAAAARGGRPVATRRRRDRSGPGQPGGAARRRRRGGGRPPADRHRVCARGNGRTPRRPTLEGVYTLRTMRDAARLQAALAPSPRRVLIIGAGFIGSEVASVCRELGLEVTVAERGPAPLSVRSAG